MKTELHPHEKRSNLMLYHYTNLGGLTGILGSKELWFTNVCDLADASEATYPLCIVETSLEKHKSLIRDDFALEAICCMDTISQNALVDDLMTRGRFSFSLTDARDSGPHWKVYGQDGMGYALGFSLKQLAEYFRVHGGRKSIERVLYSQTSQIAHACRSWSVLFEYLISYRNILGRDEELRNKLMVVMRTAINTASVAYKIESLADEKEWKLVSFDLDTDSEIEIDKKRIIKCNISEDTCHIPSLQEIIIGPALNFESSRQCLLDELKRKQWPSDHFPRIAPSNVRI